MNRLFLSYEIRTFITTTFNHASLISFFYLAELELSDMIMKYAILLIY